MSLDQFRCLLCGGQAGRVRLRKGQLVVARCQGCSFLQLHPVPGEEQAAAMYAGGAHYGDDLIAAEDMYLERDRRVLAALAGRGASGPLLDVGAGGGIILRAARERGWQAVGIEVSKPDAERIRATTGCEVWEVPLSQARLTEQHFGVVTMSHSLEHLVDPVASLERAAALLRADGVLHVAVPNWRSLKRIVAGRQVSWIYEHHVAYFTRATLERALVTAGFRPVQWQIRNYPGRDYLFVIALLRRLGLEGFLRRWLGLRERPLEHLLQEGLELPGPAWRFRAVVRFAHAFLWLWPDRLSGWLGWADELRVTARKR